MGWPEVKQVDRDGGLLVVEGSSDRGPIRWRIPIQRIPNLAACLLLILDFGNRDAVPEV
jgi:hypothetical protein